MLNWNDIQTLVPVAGSCFVMIVAQSAATARVYAARHHQRLDGNAELVGLCAANTAAAFSGTFVVNGSPTQTAMVESSGGHSQIVHLATAAVVALVLLVLTGPLQYLPLCVLGAIVFMIAVRLVDVRGLRGIRRESPGEYALALTPPPSWCWSASNRASYWQRCYRYFALCDTAIIRTRPYWWKAMSAYGG